MIKKISLIFFCWQLIIIFLTHTSQYVLPLQPGYLGNSLSEYEKNPILYSRENFDGNHYIYIATRGYGFAQQAFFPLYPMLIKTVNSFIANPVLSGVLISIVACFIGLIILAKVIALDFGEQIALWSIVALIIFPTSFFLSFVYTEGLFLFLTVSCIYLFKKNKFLLAGILGGLSSYTRLSGIFLFVGIATEFFTNTKKITYKILCVLLMPLGLITYMYQLQKNYNDGLLFIHAQKFFNNNRSEQIILLPQTFWRYIKIIWTVDRQNNIYPVALLEIFVTLLAIYLLIKYIKIHPKLYSMYFFLSIIIPSLTGTLTSIPRYMLVCFPLFVAVGQFLAKSNSRIKLSVTLSSIFIFSAFLLLFVRGYWVA